MSKNIVLLTDIRFENPDPTSDFVSNILLEDSLLSKELRSLGYEVARVAWDSKEKELPNDCFAVFRTTWNYFDKIELFQNWLTVNAKLANFINPISLIYWNLNKRYMFDLEHQGINIPETTLVEKGDPIKLIDIVAERGWEKIVIKPVISAGAYNTFKLVGKEIKEFESKFSQLIQLDDFLIQEFQENIITEGEVSMIFINGEFTHAILKKAKQGDYRVQDDFGGTVHSYKASDAQIELGEQTINACLETPIYARVDIILDNNMDWVVSELELVEPELWMRVHPECAKKLATAIDTYVSS